jgi:sec-independent protein translocase protein TatB
MFKLGFSEICTIVVVMIIVLNPKDLPLIFRKIGKIYAIVMRNINHVKQSYKDFEDDIKITEFEDIQDINPHRKKKKN